MVTSVMKITDKGRKGQYYWEGQELTSPNTEALLVDADSNPLVFNLDGVERVTIEMVNLHNTIDSTIKLMVSNFADPGSTTGTDFGADSLWVLGNDELGNPLEITVTASGTPAYNEIYDMQGKYRFLAIRASNTDSDLADALSIAICFVLRAGYT